MRNTATRWTLIGAAREGDTAAQRRFSDKYRSPVLAYVRGRGLGGDAEDVTQEVFLRLFTGGVLARADATKGRFRSLLLAVTKHTIADHLKGRNAVKRGGRAAIRSLGELEPPAPTPQDATFEQEWLLALLESSLGRLQTDHPNYHDAVRLFLLEGKSRARVAKALQRSEATVRNWVHRGRIKLTSYIREEAWNYCSTRGEYDDELAHLARALRTES